MQNLVTDPSVSVDTCRRPVGISVLTDWNSKAAVSLGLALVAVQCLAILFLVERFHLENETFRTVLRIALAGFVVHHFLPLRFRMPFFLALSIGTIAFCLGLQQGEWDAPRSIMRTGLLLSIGAALIGICHLRIPFMARVALLIAAAGCLAVFRGGIIAFAELDAIWPVLGAMFMFRIMIYIYDREHDSGPANWTRTFSYFFLFPNLWLYVFPVIDYKTFSKNYFNEQTLVIYGRGVRWMMRGIFHLLCWRLVYYKGYVDPSHVSNGAEVVQFLVANMALYLRVSGQFHFVIGLLHLFGFNLPETNRRYFLASSFTDYWRRVNIYWKDFMMKIFYYPAVVRMRSFGTTGSVLAATLVAFIATWLLHPYQWFWLRGSFPLPAKDGVFWGLLGVFVCANSYRELKYGRKRTLSKRVPTAGDALKLGLRTAATFAAITLLWSIWSCDSLTQWAGVWSKADWQTAAFGLAVLAVIALAAILLESPASPFRPNIKLPPATPFAWRPALSCCLLPAFLLTAGTSSVITKRLEPAQNEVVASLFSTAPNKSDEEFMVRGYYENLMDVGRFNAALNEAFAGTPVGWEKFEDTAAVQPVMDLRTKELVPLKKVTVNGKLYSINRWGMRDRDYEKIKAPGTYRIALIGSSQVMGSGISDGEAFESVLEEKWNAGGDGKKYEILNFAVNAYSPLSQVEVFRRRVIEFQPDAVFFVLHPEDPRRIVTMLSRSMEMGVVPGYEGLRQIIGKAGVHSQMPRSAAEQKLIPYWTEMMDWSFHQIADEARARNIETVAVYIPSIAREKTDYDEKIMNMARNANFRVISMLGTFTGKETNDLIVAPWDGHPNASAHRLIAERLWRELR
jgi:hypothetical protein